MDPEDCDNEVSLYLKYRLNQKCENQKNCFVPFLYVALIDFFFLLSVDVLLSKLLCFSIASILFILFK